MGIEQANTLSRKPFLSAARLSALCGLVVCIGDFAVTGLLGYLYDGYDLLEMSQSRLGSSGSPMSDYMAIWGFCFSALFFLFALGLRKTIWKGRAWGATATALLVIYGLGEGIGSGLFPYDHFEGSLTASGWLHSAFSGIGMTALAALPFAASRMYRKQSKMHTYTLATGWSALILIVLFLCAKAGMLPYRGLWQRLFILDYYLLLAVLARRMAR